MKVIYGVGLISLLLGSHAAAASSCQQLCEKMFSEPTCWSVNGCDDNNNKCQMLCSTLEGNRTNWELQRKALAHWSKTCFSGCDSTSLCAQSCIKSSHLDYSVGELKTIVERCDACNMLMNTFVADLPTMTALHEHATVIGSNVRLADQCFEDKRCLLCSREKCCVMSEWIVPLGSISHDSIVSEACRDQWTRPVSQDEIQKIAANDWQFSDQQVKGEKTVAGRWAMMDMLFQYTAAYLAVYEPFVKHTVLSILEDYPSTVVLELRVVVGKQTTTENGSAVDELQAYKEIEERVRAARGSGSPFFLHVIASCRRSVQVEDIKKCYNVALEHKKSHPTLVVAFDLIGQEMNDRQSILKNFLVYYQGLERKDKIPLALHISEQVDPTENIRDILDVDEVVRLSHVVSMPISATMAELNKLKERKGGVFPGIELIPMSNWYLGYTRNLNAHPARFYIKNGFSVSISNDDCRLFGYVGVELDWFVSIIGFKLSLDDIKKIVEDGIMMSFLNEEDKKDVRNYFDKAWDAFMDKLALNTAFLTLSYNTIQSYDAQSEPKPLSAADEKKVTMEAGKIMSFVNLLDLHIKKEENVAAAQLTQSFVVQHSYLFPPYMCTDPEVKVPYISEWQNAINFTTRQEGFGWSLRLLIYQIQLDYYRDFVDPNEEVELSRRVKCYNPMRKVVSKSDSKIHLSSSMKLHQSWYEYHVNAMKEKMDAGDFEDYLLEYWLQK